MPCLHRSLPCSLRGCIDTQSIWPRAFLQVGVPPRGIDVAQPAKAPGQFNSFYSPYRPPTALDLAVTCYGPSPGQCPTEHGSTRGLPRLLSRVSLNPVAEYTPLSSAMLMKASRLPIPCVCSSLGRLAEQWSGCFQTRSAQPRCLHRLCRACWQDGGTDARSQQLFDVPWS